MNYIIEIFNLTKINNIIVPFHLINRFLNGEDRDKALTAITEYEKFRGILEIYKTPEGLLNEIALVTANLNGRISVEEISDIQNISIRNTPDFDEKYDKARKEIDDEYSEYYDLLDSVTKELRALLIEMGE